MPCCRPAMYGASAEALVLQDTSIPYYHGVGCNVSAGSVWLRSTSNAKYSGTRCNVSSARVQYGPSTKLSPTDSFMSKIVSTFILWNRGHRLPVLPTCSSVSAKVKQAFFFQIDRIIDWIPIRSIIAIAYTKGHKSTGRPSYDGLVLFKTKLLHT